MKLKNHWLLIMIKFVPMLLGYLLLYAIVLSRKLDLETTAIITAIFLFKLDDIIDRVINYNQHNDIIINIIENKE